MIKGCIRLMQAVASHELVMKHANRKCGEEEAYIGTLRKQMGNAAES